VFDHNLTWVAEDLITIVVIVESDDGQKSKVTMDKNTKALVRLVV
jgi:hypothetical protein